MYHIFELWFYVDSYGYNSVLYVSTYRYTIDVIIKYVKPKIFLVSFTKGSSITENNWKIVKSTVSSAIVSLQ